MNKKFDKRLLDPEMRKVLTYWKLVPDFFSPMGCKLVNKILHKLLGGKCKDEEVIYKQHIIQRKDGGKERICIYRPKDANESAPGVLWIHGGGYAHGMPEFDYQFMEAFIKEYKCVVVSPDYRCSYEAPYPAALDDCYAALLWMKHNAEKLGIRSNQLFVGGDSAGGGLTAALTLYVRDKKTVNVAYQMPLYPMIDDRMNTESAIGNTAPVWNSELNYRGWKYYLGKDFMTDNVSKYAAPSRETDYRGLPPTCTFVGSVEPFRDETITYIENLKKAGVETHFQIYEGCYHGFDKLSPKSIKAQQANKFFMDTFGYAVEHYFAEQDDNAVE